LVERAQVRGRFLTGSFESDQLSVNLVFRQPPGLGADENLVNAIRLADRHSRRNA
jgi:hypothetical protein